MHQKADKNTGGFDMSKRSIKAATLLAALSLPVSFSAYATEDNTATAKQTGTQTTNGQEQVNPYVLPPLPVPNDIRAPVGAAGNASSILSRKEILWVKNKMDEAEAAAHYRPQVNISNPLLALPTGPGSKIVDIKLAPGFSTTLSFVDSSGAMWPVTSFWSGGGKSIEISTPSALNSAGAFTPQTSVSKDGKSTAGKISAEQKAAMSAGMVLPDNLLTISPNAYGASTNLMVTLKGMDTPIMIMLTAINPDEKESYGSVTLRLNKRGPQAVPTLLISPPPSTVNPELMSFMSDTPPKGADPLKVNGISDTKAWSYNGNVIIRTRWSVFSPGWTEETQQDGYSVYAMNNVNVLWVTGPDGNKVKVTLTGKE